MAIVFNCPNCQFPYRLKDELAGKRATCKNPDCRQVIVIPAAVTVPASDIGPTIASLGGMAPPTNGKDHTPPPKIPPVDIEAAARAALSDTQAAEEKAAEEAIPVVCEYCGHKWTEPLAKAGKNVLCPEPECRQRTKVPIPKKADTENWRESGSNKPSLAKENFEKPADVVDAEAKIVSREAWQKGGGAEQELEPIPLSRKLKFGLPILGIVLGLVFGVVYWTQSRTIAKEHRLVDEAITEYAGSTGELAPAEVPLGSAMIEMLAGEFALHEAVRLKEAKELQLALGHFAKAREEVRLAVAKHDKKTATTIPYVIGAELALATLGLGGTDEQVREGVRILWVPEETKKALRVNEKRIDVHTELQRTLSILLPADFDLKAVLARRLTRQLVKLNQTALLSELPVLLFTPAEQPEARAIVALEVYRADKGAEKVRTIATELKGQLEKGTGKANPFPASAQTLWLALPLEKAPTITPATSPQATLVPDPSRMAYVGLYLLQNKPDDAVALARRPGSIGGQLRALALCADWSTDPSPALDAAQAVLAAQKGKKDGPTPPPLVVLQLAQLAAAAGKADMAKGFADTLTDEGLKAWARGDAIRFGSTPENTSPLDEATAELPDDLRKLRAGNAWGRIWVARHNTRLSGNRGKETKAIDKWSKGTVHPFGLAGVALGLKDRE
jgi:hypothetical protein